MLTLAKNEGVDKWWYEIINLDTHSVMDKTPLSFNIAVDKYQVKKEIWLNCIEAQWILMFLFRLPLNLVINNSNLKNNEWRILYRKKCCYLTICILLLYLLLWYFIKNQCILFKETAFVVSHQQELKLFFVWVQVSCLWFIMLYLCMFHCIPVLG